MEIKPLHLYNSTILMVRQTKKENEATTASFQFDCHMVVAIYTVESASFSGNLNEIPITRIESTFSIPSNFTRVSYSGLVLFSVGNVSVRSYFQK